MLKNEIKILIRKQKKDNSYQTITHRIITPTKKFYLHNLTLQERIIWACCKAKVANQVELASIFRIRRETVSRKYRKAERKVSQE